MTRRRLTAAVAALAAVLVAGCATTIAGTAEPNPAGLTTSSSSSKSGSSPSSSDTSTSDTSSSETSADTSSSDVSSSDTSAPSSSDSTAASTTSLPSTSGGPASSEDSSTASSSTESSAASQAYPTTPLRYNRTPSTQDSANLLEGRRIASVLVVPTFIDPAFIRGGNLSTRPLRGPSAMSVLFTAPVPSVAQRAGMITGFSSARSSTTGALLVAAFEFGTAAQATAAVPALADASVDKENDKGKAVLAGYPTAAGQYGTTSDGIYLQSFLAQGRMVLYVYATDKKQSAAVLGTLAAKTFKVQSAAFGTFKPTASTALMQLLVDPEGMMAHTIPHTGEDLTVLDGYMTAAGQLHYDTDPVGTKALFAGAGVDAVGGGRATVYRAKDAAGAAAVRDSFVATSQKANSLQPYQLTSQAPGAKCLQDALNSTYYCVGIRDRYAFELSAESEADINAVVAAQYQLLAGF